MDPDFAVAYLLRAQANHHRLSTFGNDDATPGHNDARSREIQRRNLEDAIIADLDRAIELAPSDAFAWYNKGCALLERGDMDNAYNAFTKALELKPDFGEAYFNRGYVSLSSGSRAKGISDLSRAGELGIVAAYNLMKRLGSM